jgi:hypothetical protein
MSNDRAAPPPDASPSARALPIAPIGRIALWSFGLLTALRFGARAYPGWYFPRSSGLNALFNSSMLFTQIGYDLVLAAAAAAMARVLLGRQRSRLLRAT